MFRVMIVEDEMMVRLLLKTSIDWSTYEMNLVADVADGQAAWEHYNTDAPDLIVTDLKMPVMGGMELIAKIRERDKRTKIVILTCLEEFDLVRKALSLGVSDYILKLTMTPEEMEQVIGKVYRELKNENDGVRSSREMMRDKDVEKEQALKDYLFRNRYSPEEVNRLFSEMKLRLTPGKIVVCLMEIDHFEQLRTRFKDQRGQLIRMSLLNVLDEVLGGFRLGEAFHDIDNRYVLMFGFPASHNDESIETQTKEILEQIKQVMMTYFNTSVTFGVGLTCSGYERLKQSYTESVEALNLKFFLGLGHVIRYGRLYPDTEAKKMDAKLRGLPKLKELLGESHWRELEARINGLLRVPHEVKPQIINLLVQWLYWPVATFGLVGHHISERVFNYGKRLQSCDTFEEAIEVFGEFLREVVKLREHHALSREVAAAMQYIEKNYKSDIALQQIARHVGITPNYLSSLFKKEAGANFHDYLTRYRIAKAKELLLTTNLKSYEIIDHIGFTNQSYFARTFKRLVGVKPSAFRKQWVIHTTEEAANELDEAD